MSASSLLEVVNRADNFPLFNGEFPFAHPHTKKPLVPFHISLQDFQRKLPPVGLLRRECMNLMRKEEDFNAFCITRKTPIKGGSGSGKLKVRVHKDGRPVEMMDEVKAPLEAVHHDDRAELDVQVDDEQKAEADSSAAGAGGSARPETENEKEKVRHTYQLIPIALFFSDSVNAKGNKGRTEAMRTLLNKWMIAGHFPEVMSLWCDEPYAVYASPSSTAFIDDDGRAAARKPFGNVAFEMERAARRIFGINTTGVHMTAYEGEGDDMKVWIPKRSVTCKTHPMKFDSTIGGGLGAGLTPFECLVKESAEEAGWSRSMIEKYARNAGMTSHFSLTSTGFLCPSVQYIFDLKLPSRDSDEYVPPKVTDGEVDSFQLMTIPEVLSVLTQGDFAPNIGIVMIDFLVRHGHVRPENEADYLEITRRLHRTSGMAGPGAGPETGAGSRALSLRAHSRR